MRLAFEKGQGKIRKYRKEQRQLYAGRHATRAELCAEFGVNNTGRQWKRLRKAIRRGVA